MQSSIEALRGVLLAAAGMMMAVTPIAASAKPAVPAIAPVAGKPNLVMGSFPLAPIGYQTEEFFLDGTATSYRVPGGLGGDGAWNATAAETAPFKTRVVVIRPSDPAKFNGTVLVEWFNVTGGQDTPADWMVAHREILRRGYAYVGVSAQVVGVEGGQAAMQQSSGRPLKRSNPERYGTLVHPGDAYSFDIYAQAGAALKAPGASGLLGPLAPKRVLAMGESQSAAFLTTYINAVDRLAPAYDGFFVHSRFGSSASLDGTRGANTPSSPPAHVRFRTDLRVPVLTLITETDLIGGRLTGYHASRQPDNRKLRVWEVAGTAHADNYMFQGAFIDDGQRSAAELARVFQPSKMGPFGKLDQSINPGMPHHYVTQAAIAALDGWVKSGRAPASTQPLVLASGGKEGTEASFALDGNGNARGGLRTPWTDVPTMRLSGKGDPNNFIAMLAGSSELLSKAELDKLYPGGKAEYLRRFTAALDAAIRAGHLLREDRQEIIDVAAINYDAAK